MMTGVLAIVLAVVLGIGLVWVLTRRLRRQNDGDNAWRKPIPCPDWPPKEPQRYKTLDDARAAVAWKAMESGEVQMGEFVQDDDGWWRVK